MHGQVNLHNQKECFLSYSIFIDSCIKKVWQHQNVIGFGTVILQKGTTKVFSNLFIFVLLNKLQYKNESNKDLIYNIKKIS